jgi:hypothetical protein
MSDEKDLNPPASEAAKIPVTMTAEKFRARTRRSFIAAGGAALVGFLGFRWAISGNDANSPTLLRKAFRFNERIASGLFSPSRENSKTAAPAAGTEFRLNGDIGLDYEIELDSWSLSYESLKPGGGNAETKSFKIADLAKLPQVSTSAEFRCVEGWSEPVSYSGVRFSDFLAAFDPEGKTAPYVGLETPDGEYYVSIDMASMLHPQTLLATGINGVPLSDDHGAPLRLFIPVKYGIKNLKRVGRIFLAQERPRDFWAQEGYDWYSGL